MESLKTLLISPRKWTSAQFRALNLSQSYEIPADSILGMEYLPADGDEEFDYLAAELTGPSEQDLADFGSKRSLYRRSPFRLVFVRLQEAAQAKDGSEASRQALTFLLESIIAHVDAAERLQLVLRPRIPFEIRPYGIQGSLRCEGALVDISPPRFPWATFSVVADNSWNMAQDISQMLSQGFLAYEQNSQDPSHRSFVLRIDRTVLQFSTTTTSSAYWTDLILGRLPSEELRVYHSESYDLRQRDRRKEALRVIIGILRLLGTKKRDK